MKRASRDRWAYRLVGSSQCMGATGQALCGRRTLLSSFTAPLTRSSLFWNVKVHCCTLNASSTAATHLCEVAAAQAVSSATGSNKLIRLHWANFAPLRGEATLVGFLMMMGGAPVPCRGRSARLKQSTSKGYVSLEPTPRKQATASKRGHTQDNTACPCNLFEERSFGGARNSRVVLGS
jgi:hypothetical protein